MVKSKGRRDVMKSRDIRGVRGGCKGLKKLISECGQKRWGLLCGDPGGMTSGSLRSFTYAPHNRGFKSAGNTNTHKVSHRKC